MSRAGVQYEVQYGGFCERCQRQHALRPNGVTHELVRDAARALVDRGDGSTPGQMVGVLLGTDPTGVRVVLRAFSGLWHGHSHLPGWAPPLHGLEFTPHQRRPEAAPFVAFERQLHHLKTRAERLRAAITDHEATFAVLWAQVRQEHQRARAARQRVRTQEALLPHEEAALDAASAAEGMARRRLKGHLRRQTQPLIDELQSLQEQIDALRRERRLASRRVLESMQANTWLHNFRGERRPLLDVYRHKGAPPSGTGDCCAPKLLQQAAQRGIRPVAMAEMWVGPSRPPGPRIDGQLVGSCLTKCEPILGYMLCGT